MEAEAATAAFIADTTASNAMPWETFTPTAQLEPEKECVPQANIAPTFGLSDSVRHW
jgi:hypothetical protein